MRATSELIHELNRSLVEFIQVELRTGLVFAALAANAGLDLQKRQRNVDHARAAYEKVRHFLGIVDISPAEAEQIVPKIEELKAKLQHLAHEVERDRRVS